MSRYQSSEDLLWAKSSTASLPNSPNKDCLRGLRLEAQALALLSGKLDMDVFPLVGYHQHPRLPFLIGSPDGVTASGDIVEVKAPRYRRYIVPEDHMAQVRFDMFVLDVERAFYVQIVDNEIHFEVVERDDSLVLDNLSIVRTFYRDLKGLSKHLKNFNA